MAILGNNFIFALACVSICSITCKPVIKRSATDCYGTDCIIPQDEFDFNGNPCDTELLENISSSVIHALPEITDLLKNIVFVNQNTTVAALPSIVQSLEDDKDLQTSQNLLIENVTAVVTPILLEMVRLMQNQQATQQRHTQLLHNQQATQERHTQLLQNQQATQERHNQLLQDKTDGQSGLLENVTALLQQSFLPLVTNMWQIKQENLPPNCVSGLTSGQHTILPQNTLLGSFPVVCDMDTDSGRWIVFQRRYDGSMDFDRVWNDYENGFGSLSGEFWMGLNKLYVITSSGNWELRVDLEDFDGNQVYAIYEDFRIGDSSSFYRLNIGSYSGTAGDSMRNHDLNGMAFTTKDQDHDQYSVTNCAIHQRGAWWHNHCNYATLNSLYLGQDVNSNTGMAWYRWKNNWQSLKKSELKIRLTEG